MSLMECIRSNTQPAYTASRRAPDPGKICKAPSCSIRFFRKDKENNSDYKKRETCCRTCSRELQTATRATNSSCVDYDYREIDPGQLSCANCDYKHENEDFGEHCGKCSSGQQFKMKEKRK